jgi:hypothetical protein
MTTTIVSGYWSVKGKHTSESFHQWFNYTLRIHCPYIFFGNQESIDIVKSVRRDLPTVYVLLDINDFYTQKYKKHIAEHHIHVPSPEVCLIWLEKMFLVQRAKDMNPFHSDYFMWVDAGICVFRNHPPPVEVFPNEAKMSVLPKNKFVFTSSQEPYESYCVHENNYYHYISGTAFVLHKDFIETFLEIYKSYLEKIITHHNWVNTEQKILTHMYKDHEILFFKLGEGYGELVMSLY